MTLAAAKLKLLEWYAENKRDFPWRANRDPYRIWLSETMLQQTTTTAVIPYFERFVKRFPQLKTLAEAPVEAVVEAWAGLGYYSRARNLHKAACLLQERGGFPQTYEALSEFPGFGPYTSRAVASLAFDQAVGVVDGNVIRVLSRVAAEPWDWWTTKARQEIQNLVDSWVKEVSSAEMNQALMELGRTICTPKSPSCLLCPIRQHCQVFQRALLVTDFPRPKVRREREFWAWEPILDVRNGRIRLTRNSDIPFLRGQWLLPGKAKRLKTKPKTYHYRHSITHHDIFVTVSKETRQNRKVDSSPKDKHPELWVGLKEIRKYVPASLVEKALAQMDPSRSGASSRR